MALSGYGLRGAITRRNGNEKPIEMVTVPFCSVFPNGSQGLGGMRRGWKGIETVEEWDTEAAKLNFPLLLDAEVPCGARIDQDTVNAIYRRRTSSVITATQNGVSIAISGPDASLGGPGYDEGLFWAAFEIVSSVPEASLWYTTLAGSACGHSDLIQYTGPVFLKPGTTTRPMSIRALACFGNRTMSAESAPFTLVDGPSITLSARVDACQTLEIQEFCTERIVFASSINQQVLAASNAEAGEWRRRIILEDATQIVDVHVPVPRHKLHTVGQFCTSHYDCAAVAPSRVGTKNITYMTPEDLAWGNGFCGAWGSRTTGGRAPTCDFCRLYCITPDIDSYDGVCPEDCGNFFSGKGPACVSATKMRKTYDCTDTHQFELRQFTRPSEVVRDPREVNMKELRSLTAGNKLIGGVMLTQRRKPIGPCPAVAGMDDFTRHHALRCPVNDAGFNTAPFGLDPMFAKSSKLFNGKRRPVEFYNETSELSASGRPYGFYPHQWDSRAGTLKDQNTTWAPSMQEFKLFLDGRLSAASAQRLFQFITDGLFLDESTAQLKVSMITYNAVAKLFGSWSIVFEWHYTGDISWEYSLQVVNVDSNANSAPVKSFVIGLSIFFFMMHVTMELRQIYMHSVKMRIWSYFSSFFNLMDWINFITQLIAWYYWYIIRIEVQNFEIHAESYQVLSDPQATFRPFATNSINEYALLKLFKRVETLGDLQGYFASFSGISVILLVFKLIASLDFQPKMGLITRTLSSAGSNMAHFMALFSLVFIGYAVVGNLMFGSLYAGMATLADTCQTLMFFTLDFDPSLFYAQMNHAITHTRESTIHTGALEYNVYIWSYMFISVFILMNIFLAILVSAFDAIAKQTEGSNGMMTDLRDMLAYYTKMAVLPATHFISDDEMVAHIRREMNAISGECWGETELNTRANAVRNALAPMSAIVVGRGVAMEKEQVHSIVEHLIKDKAMLPRSARDRFKTRIADWQWPTYMPDVGAVSVMEQGHGEMHRLSTMSQENLMGGAKYAAVDDLMARLGDDMRQKGKGMAAELTHLMQVDGYINMLKLMTSVEEIRNQVKQHHVGEAHVPMMDVPKSTLVVTVVSANNLPRMDFLSSCDAYCMVFLNEDAGGGGLGGEYMQFMSQMRTTLPVRSRHPVWEHTMTFNVTQATRSLVLAVWDRDRVSADDLIGCVELQMEEIVAHGTEQRYYQLVHARHYSRLLNSVLCAKITMHKTTDAPL